jgi:cyclic pyranopterin phosphate synthase
MNDGYARAITYLRLSVTERCNLRCKYCMPDEDARRVSREEGLTAEEIAKVVRAAVAVGIRKVRLTGGEPTLRADIVEIVRHLGAISGVEELVMTTNGTRLAALAGALAAAGLRRVNVHLDSLDAARLRQLCGVDCRDRILAGLAAAEQHGLAPIKVNMVVVRGYNEQDAIDLARLTRERDWQVRFIELMPLGEPAAFALAHYVSSQETRENIERALGSLLPCVEGDLIGGGPLYRLPGGRGSLGFISPVSHAYCDTCNHIRVTADGCIRPCLLLEHDQLFDLRAVVRRGGSLDDLAALFREAIGGKPRCSQLGAGIYPADRPMVAIGG